VERSTLTRESIVEAISDIAEECCAKINDLLFQVLDARIETRSDAADCMRIMEKEWTGLMGEIPDKRGLALCGCTLEFLDGESA
jgi:hypothetical protein